jgi:hypothetical protein
LTTELGAGGASPNDSGGNALLRMGATMHQILRFTIAAIAGVLVSIPSSAPTQAGSTQIMLTEKHVEGFIAVQKDMSEVMEKMQAATSSDPAAYKTKLMASAKKRGFKNIAEYEVVAANISMVVGSIDPQTKEFTDPQSAIKKELDAVAADKTIAASQKKELLKELNAALKSVEPIQFSSNVDLVKKYYDKIDVTMIAAYDGESRENLGTVRTISE